MKSEGRFGLCPDCNVELLAVRVPLAYRDLTFRNPTRYYWAVDYLTCPHCLQRGCVDDSFDVEITYDSYIALGGA